MTSGFISEIHDAMLTELNQKYRRTDEEIAEEMGFNKSTIIIHRNRLNLPKNHRPRPVSYRETDRKAERPSERVNPLKLASVTLGGRLVEKPSGFWLDGVPASLDKVMIATNRILKASGAEMCLHSERWRP